MVERGGKRRKRWKEEEMEQEEAEEEEGEFEMTNTARCQQQQPDHVVSNVQSEHSSLVPAGEESAVN